MLATWGWRSLFPINLPLGIVVLTGVHFLLVDRAPATRKALHIDWHGLTIFGTATIALAATRPHAGRIGHPAGERGRDDARRGAAPRPRGPA